jgi:hypothetical protein
MDSVFGDVLYAYTRAQAIEDGVLADVSDMAKEAGFRVPVAITERLWNTLSADGGGTGQDFKGRLWDVLMTLKFAVAREQRTDTTYFKTKVGVEVLDLWAKCGPGDDAGPVITIMYQDED